MEKRHVFVGRPPQQCHFSAELTWTNVGALPPSAAQSNFGNSRLQAWLGTREEKREESNTECEVM